MRSIASQSTRRSRDVVIVVVAAAVALLYIAAAGGNFPLDDSWIHQTYGRNLAQYGEWSFVPGVPSAASTSPLYTVLLSVGYKLGIPFRLWTHGLGIAALALTGLIGARMAELAAPGKRGMALAAGLALVLAWHLVWAAVSGMETMIFSLLTLVLIWLAWRELEPRSQTARALAGRGAIFGAAAGLATLARPEGVLLAGLIGLALLIARPNMSWRGVIVWGGAALIGFAVVLAPYLILNLRLTGGLLPNTAAAKRAESAPVLARPYLWRVGNVTMPLAAGVQLLLVPGMIAYAGFLSRGRREVNQEGLAAPSPYERRASAALARGRWLMLMLALVWPLALIFLYAATLPLEFQHGRYVMPALPAAIVAGVVGIGWLLAWTHASLVGRVLVRVTAISAALLLLGCAFGIGLQAYALDVRVIDEEMVAPALWIRDHLPPDDLLVVHDIGALGYFAPRPILDIAGLVSPEVVALIQNPEAVWGLMQARGGKYLEALANQIPGGDLNDPRLCPLYRTEGTAALRAGGSKMTIYRLAWDGTCS